MGVRGVVLGSMRERRMRAAKVLPEPGGPWRMRTGNGPPGRRAARSQARQRSQPARDGRLRQARRVSRAPGAGEGCGGRGKGEGGAGGLEESIGAGGGLPAGGRDFDELAFGIGEVEEDLGGQEAAATGSDATPDGEALVLAVVVGLGFQVIEDGVEGAGGGQGVVQVEEFVEEPLAVGGGADGEDVEAAGEGTARRTKAWPSEAVKGMPRRAMSMRGARGLCWRMGLLIPV